MRTNVQPLDFNPPYLYPDYRSTTVAAPSRQLVVLPRDWFDLVTTTW
jgi:Protocatechuate 3,4-dioxygenase beta subunit N terminal